MAKNTAKSETAAPAPAPAETVDVVDADTGEVSNVPATLSAMAGAVTLAGGLKVVFKRNVTLPLLKQKDGEVVYIKVSKPYWIAKPVKPRDGKPAQEPPCLTEVVNLATGQVMQYIVPAVLKGVFDDEYTNDSYVGKAFAIKKLERADGKRHKDLQIAEIDVSEDAND